MSGAPKRVFIARLAGLAVFDPSGDQVGRVRDVVVALRIGRAGAAGSRAGRGGAGPAAHLRADDPGDRDRPGQVITTGLVNMRRFEQRSTETLVLGELLDRKVTLIADGRTGDRPGRRDGADPDPRLAGVQGVRHAAAGPAGCAAAGESMTVDWDAVTGFSLAEQGQGAANLLATFEKLNARPTSPTMLHELSSKRRLEVAAALTTTSSPTSWRSCPRTTRWRS